MARHALLNNVTHQDLRVVMRYGSQYGDQIGTVPTFPTEFADVQREYPIFFRKDPDSGEFQSIVLLGFDKDENLFLGDNDRWDATYLPGMVARGPFLIGFQEQEIGGELKKEPVIHVDLDHPRISHTEGEPVFLPQGGNSRYLEHVAQVLKGIREGLEISKSMFAAFNELDLIEPIKLEIKFSEEEQCDVVGLYTISAEKLRALNGEALLRLNKSGFLQGAFLVLASQGNVRKLINMKQIRRTRRPS